MKVRGSGINSEHRFEWFEVRLLKVREVRGSEISGSFQVYLDIPMFGFTFLLWVVLLHNSLIAKKLKKSTLNGRTNDELSSLLLNREPLKSVAVVKSGAIKMTFITR